MNLKLFLSATLIAVLAEETVASNPVSEQISFSTARGTELATAMLHEKGLHAFMNEAWKQGVAAPGIHSKYWLDQFTRGKPELYAIEKAYRDFGYEIAVQVEDLAFKIYEKPDKNLEYKRLDWWLRFSKWMLRAGRFENLRIGIRAEDAATMSLLRAIFNFDVPVDKIENCFARFTSTKESATLRANILFEESDGNLDVRNLAKKAKDGSDDGFEAKWIEGNKQAYRHFGGRLLNYSIDQEILLDEEVKYSFFADDDRELGGRDNIPERWDDKCHKEVCVFGGQASYLRELHKPLVFRREVGSFPEVPVPEGKDSVGVYENYYSAKYNSEPRMTTVEAKGVASFYVQFKNNTYMDYATYQSSRTKASKRIPKEKYERRSTTRERRALNQQWLKKNRKSE